MTSLVPPTTFALIDPLSDLLIALQLGQFGAEQVFRNLHGNDKMPVADSAQPAGAFLLLSGV